MTINGTFCYADKYEDFVTNCQNKTGTIDNTTHWIVANMFSNKNSNDMIKNASKYNESQITGLIFISNQEITSEHRYEHPELIALID